MAVLDHHDMSGAAHDHEVNRRALTFLLTWIGFFALIGAVSWLASLF
jgi:hypothetical protein